MTDRKELDLSGMTLVVGLGKTGLSMTRTLSRLGAQVAVTDSRAEPPALSDLRREFPELPCYLGGFPAPVFAGAARLLVSPGVSIQTPPIQEASRRGVPVWGDVELFARLARAPVAAITGSNGKSTVTTLLGSMAERAGLRAAVGGNLGTPCLELLEQPTPAVYVLELSSFQLETTFSLNAQVATVLNISPDHMDRYPDLESYARAKQRIFQGSGWQIINADDPWVAAMAEPDRPQARFSLQAPLPGEFGLRQRDGVAYLAHGDERWLAATELKIGGLHNLANALAALAMGQVLGLAREAMLEALRAFTGLAHRTQLIAEHRGVRWYDDSKGTNVGATVAAVNGLPGPLIVIAGGDGKGQDFTPLKRALADKVRALVLIGRDAPLIAAAVDSVVAVHHAADMDQAVALAAQLACPGDSVLLSPACASFDMFSDYRARGAAFTAATHRQLTC